MKRYKIILIGESDVGKSSLVCRFQKGEIYKHATSTIGMAFSTERICVNAEPVILEMWDSAGQERFRSIVPMYFKGAKAVVIVYDLSNPRSADLIKSYWKEQIESYFPKKLPIIALVGNKIDLISEDNQTGLISQMSELQELFNVKVMSYFTSAVTGENVQHLFEDVATKIHNENISSLRNSTIYLRKDDPENTDSALDVRSNCCSI